MDFGDFDDLIEPCIEKSKRKQPSIFGVKVCEPMWFLDDSKLTDEDDIKFKADYHYFKKNYDTALNIYMDLLKEKRFGSNRSLMAEVYESIALCYNRLGQPDNALLFCIKSNDIGKSADHKLTNLFIRSRLLIANPEKGEELLDVMRRLLILHPYNHFLWLEYSLLHTDHLIKLISLLRTRLLLKVNKKGLQGMIKLTHEHLQRQVDTAVTHVTTGMDSLTVEQLASLIKDRDGEGRNHEEWQTENYKLRVLECMSCEEVKDEFLSRWERLADKIR